MRIIFHLDIDCYFVSAERTINKSLIGKSVVISTGTNRSIISAASYEAQAKGIYVPMPFYKAKLLDPNLISVEPNFALYSYLSSKMFLLIAKKFTNKIEVASIDECYIDVTSIFRKYKSIYQLAKTIQTTIFKVLGLNVSIGAGTNKFIAKMSTAINKPKGITITKPKDFRKRFWPMPIRKFFGIGESTARKLNNLNIFTIGDLAKANEARLKKILGKIAINIIQNARGLGEDKLNYEHNNHKSLSSSITFLNEDKEDFYDIENVISSLALIIAHRLEIRNLCGKVIFVVLKYSGRNQSKIRKQITLKTPIIKYEDIFNNAKKIFNSFWANKPLRFIELGLGKLESVFDITYQDDIFSNKIPTVANKSLEIIKEVNNFFKKKVLFLANETKELLKGEQTKYLSQDGNLKHFIKKN